jgi:uracil-DNA glycosylase family 4
MRVYGEGPIPCSLVFIGEFPGIEEGRRGRPFAGKSGKELRRYLNGYELPEAHEVYLTNFSKTVAPSAKEFTFDDEDERDLFVELEMLRPATIVTLGAHVTKFFLGDVTLEAVHGIPHQPNGKFSVPAGDDVVIFPMYNPAAMLHSPTLQSHFAQDMRWLSAFLKGKLPPAPVDQKPGRYVELAPGTPFDAVVASSLARAPIAVDTEGVRGRAWGLSYTAVPYHGVVVRTDRAAEWGRLVMQHRPRLVLHNSLHDLGILRELGCDLDEAGVPFDDTMIMAYLLGLEPQGLKPLAYRHAGMQQDDYSDVVAVPNAAIAEQWMMALYDRLPDKPVKKLAKKPKGAIHYDEYTAAAYSDDMLEMARVKGLVGKMIFKGEPETLRKRWEACRSREILLDELEVPVLTPYDADPPEATLDDVPLEQAVNYAGRDADCTIRIYPRLNERIDTMGLRDVYETDIGVVPVFERMQIVGLKADLDHFKSLSLMLAVEESINREDIARMAGRPVNPNSGDQVAVLLFDELKLHEKAPNLRLKRTDSGTRFSTNDKTLEALETVHPIVKLITDGREIRKIKGTYCDPMPGLVARDGRLHPRYRITRTDTGRPSAAEPNVLAFPKHSKRGKKVRDGFVADDGREMGEWDLDQIEMRVFASDSQDEAMIAEFLSGIDKHAGTAGKIFGRDPIIIYEEYKADEGKGGEERFAAKAVNFGILMGITPFGLLDQFHKNDQLQWTLEDCEKLLQEWFKAYPQGKTYIDSKHAEARRYGYVRDMWGRLRWLEGIHSTDLYIRAEAERQAQATPTQSGAQGIIKRVMKAVWPAMKALRQDFWVEPLLQIHDALITEHDARRRAEIDGVMMAAMHTTVQLRVPVTAKAKFGQRWGDL